MNINQNSIPEDANSWLRVQIGDFHIIDAYRQASPRTGVWLLHSDKGKYYFKINRRRNRWGSEVYAYKTWIPFIAPKAPKLLSVFENETNPGLLLSEMPGKPLSEVNLKNELIEKAYYQAGEILRKLHESMIGEWFGYVDEKRSPIDWSGKPLNPELLHNLPGQKLEILHELLENDTSINCFESSERQILQWAIESVGCYASEKPVPTSEDFTPGNWLVDDYGNLTAIIDFENMLWGDVMFPFPRLVNDYFPYFPYAEKSFFTGYGSCPPCDQPIQLKIACAIYAGNYVIMGTKNNNKKYLNRGKAAFQRIVSS